MASPQRGQNCTQPPRPPPRMRAIDRLSDLPDSVLTHLLSFLPTKMCVATSILSKRWRFLWQYVPVIHLYDQNQDTVSRFLLLHKVQRIDTFRLGFENENSHNPQIDAWIVAAVERNVRNLHLSFSFGRVFMLPFRLFTCETLVHLSLSSCGTNLCAVCLPRLKNLCLMFFRFESYESLPRLLSGCPVLEELHIQQAEYRHLVRCNISSPTLKKLALSLSTPIGREDDNYNRDYKLELNTPALEDLFLYGLLSDVETGPLSSLSEASVGFFDWQCERHAFLCYTSLLNFLNRLNDVKYLEIYFARLNVFWDVSLREIDSLLAGWTVSFNNLTKLDLFAKSRFLPKFLKSANNLQCLYFREREVKVRYREKEVESWIEPNSIPTCLVSHLRTIRLGGLYGVRNELEMIRYLLKNAQVLETMEISFLIEADNSQCDSGKDKKAKLIEEISLSERGSATCELIFR